jgi:mannonate dehydratase
MANYKSYIYIVMVISIAFGAFSSLQPRLGAAQNPGSPAQARAERPLRSAWAIRVTTDEVLKLAAQMGVRDLVIYGGPGTGKLPGTDQPNNKPRGDYEDYLALRKRVESYGLHIAAIEGGFVASPRYHDVFFGGPKRDELIAELIAEIQDMARAGIPIFCYHWMGASVWRTKSIPIRGGAIATAFDYDLVKDMNDRATCEKMQARGDFSFGACNNVPESPGQVYSEEDLWKNLEYWIVRVTPAAEKAGIRLGIHPDDPPVPQIGGVPRLLRNHAAFRRLVEMYPSDSNGIEFCQGTFSEMPDDVYDAIRYFGSRNKILYVHFRNVSGRVPKFHEEFINTGYVDMPRAMRLYKEIGYKGVIMDDHCPNVEGDVDFPGNLGGYRSRSFALGYIQALLDQLYQQ